MRRTLSSNTDSNPALVVPPAATFNPPGAAWPAANRAVFLRFHLPSAAAYRYADWVCSTASGNVQIGVVSLSGANRTTYTRVMNSGIIAAPTAGNIRTDLSVTTLPAGDYAVFIWADNTTFQTRYAGTSGTQALRMAGIASSLATGVLSSGTLSWDGVYLNLTLEADV